MLTTLVAVLHPVVASAVGTTLFDQPFHNNTPDGLGSVTLPPLPTAGTNAACLTAAGNAATGPLRSCAGATDPQGTGKLRLTDTAAGKTGGVFGAASVPTSMGLDVTFNLYQWGSATFGADGMAFALAAVDPANPTAPAPLGQSGGDLGYSGTRSLNGLANGYLGIGFDVYGNYSTSTYQGSGCVDPPFISSGARIPGQVVVRGPGRGTVGYCGLNSTATNASSPVVPLRAATRAASVVPVEVVINPTTSSFTTASGLVVAAGRYLVRFTPVGQAARSLEGPLPAVAPGLYPSATWLNSNGVPRQLAFGWVGSTGSVVDNHEVDNVRVVTFNPVPDLNVTQTSYTGPTPQPGDPVTYSVVAGVDAGADETAPVSVTETLPTGVVPVGAFGSGWTCAAPVGQRITCTNSNAPFSNGSTLTPITVVGIVTGTGVTPALIQTGSTATASSIDANPGISTTTVIGTVPATPSGITVTPASSTIAGGIPVTVGGTNLAGATAIEIGTTAEQRAGTPVTLLPCQSGPAAGCFTVNGDGTLAISSMPARGSAATVTVTVVTRGVAAAANYVYTDRPATPVAPTATAGLSSATVSWTAPSSNGSPITGYIITPTRNGVAQTPISYDASTTTRTLTGLTVGASYTFTVAAVNAIGTGSASPASNAVVPFVLPGTPTITAASAGDSSATLTWTAPSNGGSPILSYVVTPYVGGVAQTPQTFTGTGTTRTVTGLTPGITYTFTVAATNAGGTGSPSAQSTPVIPNVSPTLSNPAPPLGEVGAAYSVPLTVNGGTAPFVWSISAGTLPAGVTLNAGTGLLSGTPTTAGTFAFTVQVLDASGESATQALTVVIAPAPTLTFPAPPQGQVGIGYSIPLTVTGGTAPFTWSITAGSLPPGLTLNTGTGQLSGTPTLAGNYSFTVRVVDSFAQSATRTVALGITASPTLSFPPPPPGQVGVPYSVPLTVTGGTAPFVWSVSVGSLPPGLTLDAGTGLLSGTPTTAGTYPFTVRVVDAAGQEATEAVNLVIAAGPLIVTKSADLSSVAAGQTVHYSITVNNTSSVAFTGVALTDPLAAVLDDAAYNGDATTTSGAVSFAGSTLSWTGDLAAGAVATITYSVTVNGTVTGNQLLTNTVTSATLGTNCASGSLDIRCTTTVPIAALAFVKTADAATATPGDVVRYTVTVTNTGQAAYTGAGFTDALTSVLDDATYNVDATATAGTLSFTSPNLVWSGNLAVGASVTVSYSVTVRSPDPGNRTMTNTVVSTTLGNNCPSGGTDVRCTAVVTVLVPGLVLTNVASTSTATPGSTVGYTVTVTNTGQTAYTGISVTTALLEVLDGAVWNGDATTSSGVLSFTSSTLTWTGNVAVGGTVTITFSVTLNDPAGDDRVLTSVVSSTAVGNNCAGGSTDPRCTATVTIVIPGLTLVKTANTPSTTPGNVVAYQIVVTNTGQSAYVGATFTDSLAGVLDDAVYDANASATSGVVSYSSPTLSWTGNLAVGATATITYSVTVAVPDSGDRSLTNTVVSPTVGANCATGSTDLRCTAVVGVLLPGLTISNTPSASTTTPGGTVSYTITIANTGESAYPAATVTESLTDVLDDATYNGDATADSGTVGVASSVLTWTGALAAGATATVRFSVTVLNPNPGSQLLTSTVTSTAANNNCPTGGTDPACTATVTVLTPGLAIEKTADTATTTPGGTVTYTITVTNSGQTAYVGANFTDSLANALNDATYNNDAVASAGSVSYAAPVLSWVGNLAVGATVSVTYSMTILNPDPGDKLLSNTVVSTTPGNNCPAGGTDPRCSATVQVLVPGLVIAVTSGVASTAPGAVVGYTVTITNSGQTAYPSLSVTDALAGVLDDATYNNDVSASAGSASFTSPNLSWTGPLALGATVTITYSVTVDDPVGGDLILTNQVVSAAAGSNCPAGGSDTRCVVAVPVARLEIVTTADAATVTPGGVLRFDTTYTNTGQVPYTGISVAFDGSEMIDEVIGNGDQTASSGILTIGSTGSLWTGDIPVGGTVNLSGSVTVVDPYTGDGLLTGSSVSTVPGNNCPSGSADPQCSISVAVLIPGLGITTVADTSAAAPGQIVGYTVTMTNSGTSPYSAISVTNELAGVLDDATYNADAVASAGSVGFAGTTLTWTGSLAVGAVATIDYTVTVRDPDPGDKTMISTVSSTAVGSSCSAAGQAVGCTSTVAVLTPGLTIVSTADSTAVTPGSTLTYTVTITNSGQLDYTAISVADDLSEVIDDATFNDDTVVTGGGTASYTAPVLTWSGDLAVGATVTLVFTVTIDNPVEGDSSLVSTITSGAALNNCPVGGTDPRCVVTVAVVGETTLSYTKTADVASTVAGSVVTYTIVVENSGGIPYLGAELNDDLADVLSDASYNNDASSNGGGTFSYDEPLLEWTGDLPANGSVVLTYSVTVDALAGNAVLVNTVESGSLDSNCSDESTDLRCTATVTVSALTIANTADRANVTPGGVVRFTTTMVNGGSTPFFGVSVAFGGSDMIDDADPIHDEVSSGTIAITPAGLVWTGDIPVGATITVASDFRVKNPDPGNKVLSSTASSTIPGNNCPTGGTDPRCTASVDVLLPAMSIVKTADRPTTVPGGTVNYTITISNTGTAPYLGAVVADDMAGALDDATYVDGTATATTGSLSFGASTLTWTGDLGVGASAVITYPMTVLTPDPGDKLLANRVSSAEVGNSCPPASPNPGCGLTVAVLTPALSIGITAGAVSTTAGGTVTYTVNMVNTGQTAQSGVAVTNALAGLLDDATYNGDATPSVGVVVLTGTDLVWTGSLAPGSSATITYSVTVNTPDAGNHLLTSTVSSTAAGNTCAAGNTNPACTAVVTVSELTIANSANAPTTVPGAQIQFSTRVENTGATPYTDIVIDASFAGAVDDGTYNGDATASVGTLALIPGIASIRWTGNLGVGEVLVVTGSFTVNNPVTGNRIMTSVVSSAVPGNNCPAGGTDPACTATVTVLVPALAVLKTADTATVVPGGTVGYTITVTNTGETPYTGATVADSLAGLLLDATYNGDADADVGVVSYADPVITWTGDLAIGATATISYTVTADDPQTGGRVLSNVVTSSTPGSNCPAGGSDPDCAATVSVLLPALSIAKHADSATTTPGSTLGYTITVTNSGQTPYTGASLTDDLTEVLDDASYQTAAATVGVVSYTDPVLTWTGDLEVGASAVITYSVAIDSPATGDQILTNAVSSTTVGGNCPPAGTDPACAVTVTVLIPALSITNVADVTTAVPGQVIRRTGTITNIGPTAYTGIQINSSLLGIIDDARPNGDQVASSGTLSVVGPNVTWTGDIPVGGVVTITGTVTVNNPDLGDRVITNTVTTTAPGSNCPPASPGPACTLTVNVLVPGLTIVKTADSPNTTPGDTVTYTVTATNTGETPYVDTTVTDSLSGLLANATYNADATAATGTLLYTAPNLVWRGDLPVGAAVEISYTVTVNGAQTGGRILNNVVTSAAQGSNCPVGGTDPRCAATVAILIPGLSIAKTADTVTAAVGDQVTYTVTVANTGQTPYTGATFDDLLSEVLDEADFNDDAEATVGTVSYDAPVLTWTGDLPVGVTAVITYSVTVDFPASGDTTLVNTVTSDTVGANCPGGPACEVTVNVLVPELIITKTANTAEVVAGGVVQYSVLITNAGQTPYTGATVTDSLAGVLDDASYNADATTTTGTVSYAASNLTWTGDLVVGATAAIVYTVTVNQPVTGDGLVVNSVSSSVLGNNCPAGNDDLRCVTETSVVGQFLTLTSLIPGFAIGVHPDSVIVVEDAVTMTVTTNSPTGYVVAVQALVPAFVPADPDNPYTIPIENLRVRGSGTQVFQPLSAVTPVIVHRQSTPSAPGGDAISSDYQAVIPMSTVADSYSATLEYVAITQ
ncbi:putative repeat protein (TIGR01451 family) [Plantactinospora soyae]|uniref:Repeat protein (TIGR01451 family) n=1 Tax=Plantactinospora soyae TaxID=1544732 RepID=A0A927R471_9ACTN|nr:putative repeat protein (TIGR01451 family) [Plantactinospora soyae]